MPIAKSVVLWKTIRHFASEDIHLIDSHSEFQIAQSDAQVLRDSHQKCKRHIKDLEASLAVALSDELALADKIVYTKRNLSELDHRFPTQYSGHLLSNPPPIEARDSEIKLLMTDLKRLELEKLKFQDVKVGPT